MSEVWISALGWEDHYEVSDRGRIRAKPSKIRPSRHSGKIMKPYPHSKGLGHLTIRLERNGKHFKTMLSRLILSSFTKLNPKNRQAAHRNGNASDNRLENLYWATQAENEADKVRHGTAMRGRRHHNYKHGRTCKTYFTPKAQE